MPEVHVATTIPENTLTRMVSAFNAGNLVPFLGAGVSVPNCTSWRDFIPNLETHAGIAPTSTENSSPTELTLRANKAVRSILLQSPRKTHPEQHLADIVRNSLLPKKALTLRRPTLVTAALATIKWPLVISTNYDDWFLGTWNENFAEGQRRPHISRMEVCGREAVDCERLLHSLRSPDNPLLWAIQGFLGGQHPDHATFHISKEKLDRLARQIVVGHTEYRRETHRSPGFRRAFTEVFRSRSFMFVGSGLSESYFENLFDEALELQGSLPHMHYAFLRKGQNDIQYLRQRFQILTIEYDRHEELPRLIDQFREALTSNGLGKVDKWSADIPCGRTSRSANSDLEIVGTRLVKPGKKECIIVSGGNGKIPSLSPSGQTTLETAFGPFRSDALKKVKPYALVWQLANKPAFIAVARSDNRRDARVVFNAMVQTLDAVVEQNFSKASVTLLASGQRRVFASYVSFIQMLRGYAHWKRTRTHKLAASFCLTVHITDDDVLQYLSSNRLRVHDIVSEIEVRFWLEVWRTPSDIERNLVFANANQPLHEILEGQGLPINGWIAKIAPSPTDAGKPFTSHELMDIHSTEPWTPANAGIVPGSTLRIVPDYYAKMIGL